MPVERVSGKGEATPLIGRLSTEIPRLSPYKSELEGMRRNGRITSNNIVSVGFELEGGMSKRNLKKLERYVHENGLGKYYQRSYEIFSRLFVGGLSRFKNLELRFWSADPKVLNDFLDYAYNECGFKTNSRCGFHVHLAFDDMPEAVSVFSSRKLASQFRQDYGCSFPEERYQSRLSSHYCTEVNVLTGEGGEARSCQNGVIMLGRNSAINLAAYRKHGTIEFRILPNQLTSVEAISSLSWIVSEAKRLYGKNLGNANDRTITADDARIDVERYNHANKLAVYVSQRLAIFRDRNAYTQ